MTETILREIQTPEIEQPLAKSKQRISKTGRILVSKKGWALRGLMLSATTVFMIFAFSIAFSVGDLLLIYSTVMLAQVLAPFIIGWVRFRNRATGQVPDDLVSVIIPVYNQENLIERVLDAVFSSTYANLEVVAVNDGSRDRTAQILDEYAKKNPQLKVIHKPNGGKRTAIARGFYAARGDFLVFIDSDSIIDSYAIEELMKTFAANPKVGGVVCHGKVLNSGQNWLTKCQDAWYDYSFNLEKATESTFGTVLCLSGMGAAYRRQAVVRFMDVWARDQFPFGDDRHLTTYVMATPWAKRELATVETRLMDFVASYDDAEDRGLTSQAMAVEWETVYAPTAFAYTEAPDTPKKYFKQQLRWRKAYLRTSFFVSAFFWRKNPVISFLFYMQFMSAFLAPAMILTVFLYGPLFLHSYLYSYTYLAAQLLIGAVISVDYKLRDPAAKHWTYMPIMNLLSCFVLSWLLFPAIFGIKNRGWLTR
jgi:hyaluronan synthase